jgi:hypothetical protein
MAANNLYGGRLGDAPSTDSLANYLESAFDFIRINDYGLDPLTEEGREERMMLFLGIARGIVDYLADHAAALVIDDHGDSDPWEHDINTTGHVRIRADGSLHPT